MKLIKTLQSNLYTRTIGFIIVILLVFASIAMLIGYYGFTATFTAEYNDSAYRAAVSAESCVNGNNISKYLEMGEEKIQSYKPYFDSEDVSVKNTEDGKLAMEYLEAKKTLSWICNTQEMSVVYVILPDSDYENYTSIFNCLNDNSTFTPWEVGHRTKTSSDLYKNAYKRIMEGHSSKEVVTRINHLNGDRPHVTILIPIYDDNRNVTAILCTQRYVDDLFVARRNYLQGVGALSVITIVLIIMFSSRFINKQLVGPIKKISAEAERFARENVKLDKPISEGLSELNELNTLALSLEKMEEDTVHHIRDITNITKESERIGTELSLAKTIQAGMLPDRSKFIENMKGFSVFATMTPAREVGGDFYDYFMADETHVAILIADVSDKGMGAAFFMAISKTIIKVRALMGGSAAEILSYTDALIAEKNPAGMFVTVWFAIIDLETGHVDCCNAGHDYPAILKEGEGYSIEKTPHGPPIAFLPGAKFVVYEFNLKPGERIFLYTDGINEAKRSDGERYGTARMLEVLNDNQTLSDEELLKAVKNSVDAFVGMENQFDDQTMLSFTYEGLKKVDK